MVEELLAAGQVGSIVTPYWKGPTRHPLSHTQMNWVMPRLLLPDVGKIYIASLPGLIYSVPQFLVSNRKTGGVEGLGMRLRKISVFALLQRLGILSPRSG